MIEKGSFFTVSDFMRNELELKGNELMTYAIIYGFSQNGKGCYFGRQEYIANWCGISRKQVNLILKSLEKKKLIKTSKIKKGAIVSKTYIALRPDHANRETEKKKTDKNRQYKTRSFNNYEKQDYDFEMIEKTLERG